MHRRSDALNGGIVMYTKEKAIAFTELLQDSGLETAPELVEKQIRPRAIREKISLVSAANKVADEHNGDFESPLYNLRITLDSMNQIALNEFS